MDSHLDKLPSEIIAIIMQYKHKLETENLKAFSDDFIMHVIKCKKVKTYIYPCKTKFYFYESIVHLTYKPTQKSIIMPFSFGAYESEEPKPEILNIIDKLCLDAYYIKNGEWVCFMDNNGQWKTDFSYQKYCESEEEPELTLQQFIRWRVQVRKTELMLGDEFEKFVSLHSEIV
jgi:hypothetical protein